MFSLKNHHVCFPFLFSLLSSPTPFDLADSPSLTFSRASCPWRRPHAHPWITRSPTYRRLTSALHIPRSSYGQATHPLYHSGTAQLRGDRWRGCSRRGLQWRDWRNKLGLPLLRWYGAWALRRGVQSRIQLFCVFEGGAEGDGLHW